MACVCVKAPFLAAVSFNLIIIRIQVVLKLTRRKKEHIYPAADRINLPLTNRKKLGALMWRVSGASFRPRTPQKFRSENVKSIFVRLSSCVLT